jgi:uncharacterized radical SAM protein YgiQ
MFIPTTRTEIDQLGWDALDIILVTGDSYVDSPYIGVAVIGQILLKAGYRVGIIAQPDVQKDDIRRLGEPELFWGVSGGSIDSMVANYTATKKRKKSDDLTPGGTNNRRPDRASIVYTNLIRKNYKNTSPIVLGGVEASLRRIAHYDFWSNKVRRSVLFDAKADLLVYGMAETTILELAKRIKLGQAVDDVRGICYISREQVAGAIELPAFDQVLKDKTAFTRMFNIFYQNCDPITAKTLSQLQDTRYLVQNPPAPYLEQSELDRVHAMKFERAQHPFYEQHGSVRALETIKFALATHRGCYGECNFCSIAVHQGRTVRWRSENSIANEAKLLTGHPDFKGSIHDVGGPTANMYGFECKKKLSSGSCDDKRCLYPEICPALKIDHTRQISLLQRLRQVRGVKNVFVASGVRYDMVMGDKKMGSRYLSQLVRHHISGQMKVAPEHSESRVLKRMGKTGTKNLIEFRKLFYEMSRNARKKQFLTYYLIAAHPGCTERDMHHLKRFAGNELKIRPEQVQIFTPTPSTYSSLMYYTERDPFTGEKLVVEKEISGKNRQKNIMTRK